MQQNRALGVALIVRQYVKLLMNRGFANVGTMIANINLYKKCQVAIDQFGALKLS
jgi:hypothetical protein